MLLSISNDVQSIKKKTKPKPVCPNGCGCSHFLVPLYWYDNNEFVMKDYYGQLHADGTVCLSYWDGTRGIVAEDYQQIEDADTVYCKKCMAEAVWNFE